ncbi:MAG TPA: nucleotide disphospho-sugar-binding domain-containing protein [Acidimicrobiales bacterium]|nr:nucleotide disphospho-sugar-binding domain-containing protein [Acidimicrobiales bacterium]
MADAPTVLFVPESAYGPTNNCIGVGHRLLQRGLRVAFAAERSWGGRLEPLGFVEELVDLAAPDPNATAESAGQFWKDYINAIAPEFAKPTIAQLATVIRPIWEELIAGSRFSHPRLLEIVETVRPDVIVQDDVIGFPALTASGVPFVRMVSCNPLEIPGPGVAPTFSGLAEDDAAGWADFRAAYRETHGDLWRGFAEWFAESGGGALPELEFCPSGALNLYVYPEELDYVDARPLDGSWHRVESSVRATDAAPELPAGFATGVRPIVYFSLGSLGSADVSLMRRVIDALAVEPYDVIVSLGPRHDEIDLAPNMWGAEFVPQTRLLPLADLVITHGGNNTTTEAMHFGKPMVVLPLFWDQYDNAQRVDERGFGARLASYGFSADELCATVARLLGDDGLRARCAAASSRIRAADGVGAAAALVESVALRRA